MAFFHPNVLTSLHSSFSEQQWLDQIRQTLKEELEDEPEIPVTIFAVPKALKDINPDSYIPRQVAIGPYHHLRPELYDMERYKVSAARRSQKESEDLCLERFVEHLMNYEIRIRASYHRPLNYGGKKLAWMMAIDTCFLLDFFQVSGIKKGRVLNKLSSRLSQLIDLSGNKIAQNDILRDITMLENQIPLFVMRMLLEFQLSTVDFADEILLDMLIRLSKDLSPFKMGKSTGGLHIRDCPHLLDFLYHFVVPKSEVASEIIEINEEEHEGEMEDDNPDSAKPSYLRQATNMVRHVLFNKRTQKIKRIILSKPIEILTKLPLKIISKIPVVKMFKGPIEKVVSSLMPDDNKGDGEESDSDAPCKPPLLEEITIPCVTELLEVGVKFAPINSGITSINFNQKTLTLSIPTIVLDVNSDVVLRNLVAYEACTSSGPLVLTRYTELMNGIIDTESDVQILCQRGIIVNHLKSEKEVSDLWNGMSKSIRLTKVPSLDRMIADVNTYYNGRWKVKIANFFRDYVFGSWKILTFLAAIMLMLLMSLQAFCQVYTCARIFYIPGLQPSDEDD